MVWSTVMAWLALAFALVSLLLLAMAPAGWRLGWWHFRFAFYRIMTVSGASAAAAVLAAIAALVWGGASLSAGELVASSLALLVGVALVYVPWHYRRTLGRVPRIHDISTDTDNPPAFVAVMPARAAEAASSAAYEGDAISQLQKAAYPDIHPLAVAAAPPQAFELALATARAMPGWAIIGVDATKGRLEASQTSRWFGFTDDIVIRVQADGSGSRIDVRSLSRQGRSDFGVNAGRIRAFLTALRTRIASGGLTNSDKVTAAR
jgi:uncharacterized protein (DUF1499 family)